MAKKKATKESTRPLNRLARKYASRLIGYNAAKIAIEQMEESKSTGFAGSYSEYHWERAEAMLWLAVSALQRARKIPS